MRYCPRELESQHYRAAEGIGHGVVGDGEEVALVVYRPPTKGMTLVATIEDSDFPRDPLVRMNLSLARLQHTSLATIISEVVDERGGERFCVGAAVAKVCELREIEVNYAPNGLASRVSGKAFCVVDLVEAGDHEGHSALGYSDLVNQSSPLKPPQRAQVRNNLRRDLRDAFATIYALESIFS